MLKAVVPFDASSIRQVLKEEEEEEEEEEDLEMCSDQGSMGCPKREKD